MKRHAISVWKGTVKEGSGVLTSQSKILDQTAYSFSTRFADETGKKGTNPEELIAAAHAGCFNMALSLMLTEAGFTPKELHTKATVNIDADKLEITTSHLDLTAEIEGISREKFEELANNAKKGCPVSKVLNCDISLNATLK